MVYPSHFPKLLHLASLSPILLTFLLLSSLLLAPVGAVMVDRGFETGRALVVIALGMAPGSAVLLAHFLRIGNTHAAES